MSSSPVLASASASTTAAPTHLPAEAPPPYYVDSDIPALESDDRHETESFARLMFWLGFVLPLFWLAGLGLLFSELRAPDNWEPEKTAEQRQDMLNTLRRAELLWAKRCLWALVATTFLALILFLIIKFSILGSYH